MKRMAVPTSWMPAMVGAVAGCAAELGAGSDVSEVRDASDAPETLAVVGGASVAACRCPSTYSVRPRRPSSRRAARTRRSGAMQRT